MLRVLRSVRLLAIPLFAACSKSATDTTNANNASTDAVPALVTISPADSTVPIDGTFPYTVVVKNAKGATITGAPLLWLSNTPAVATVSSTGVLRAVAPGNSIITAIAANGAFGVATLRVLVPVSSVTVTRPSVSLPLDAKGQFTATLKDSAGATLTGRVVTWTSSDPSVASVNGTGLVTALTPGLAIITATSEGKSGSSQIIVDFSTLPIAAITLAPSALRVQTGTAEYFQISGVDINGRSIGSIAATISVADTNILRSFSSSTLLLGRRAGSTTVTATVAPRTATLTVTVQDNPVAVEGPSIVAGLRHACALDGDDAAWCWGENGGQLGNGTFSNPFTTVRVSGGLTFATLTAGRVHTCGLTRAGATYCWGDNSFGQLGRPLTTTASNVPLAVPGVPTLYRLASRSDHTCGLAVDGQAYCWGANTGGQLGDNSRTNRPGAVPVSGASRFLAIAAGALHSCGIERTSGDAYCWGTNSSYQLGDGTNVDRLTPTRVAGANAFHLIFAGGGTSCATSVLMQFWCWGSNANPRDVGVGNRTVPSFNDRFSGQFVLQASLTAGVSCSVGGATIVWCWGSAQLRNFGASNATSDGWESTPALGVGSMGVAVGGELFGCRLVPLNANGNRATIACWGTSTFGTAIGVAPPVYRGAANSWR